ncbi:MAG: ribosome small subunit-dependent GTPase A [Bermanella sp.]|nr:ribosome small subunit-dependent GTPase A [Bermanella sp.]|tara:strand:- start:4377 stop:5432 length:1056 start_codon:yes stop_codon:yes gene_type:complete
MNTCFTLPQLGWRGFFQTQLSFEELESFHPVRISEHHRNQYHYLSQVGQGTLAIHPNMPAMTVGDWLLLDENGQFERLLERQSYFSRKASGSKVHEQSIASNVDTVFIVASLNDDFNLNRIERYLAITHEAQSEPVVVLTKADLCDDIDAYLEPLRKLDHHLMIEVVNALDSESLKGLQAWCKSGQTIALLGSSGVGKSTLVNTLKGLSVDDATASATQGIREDDSKGRHTTTSRQLHFLPQGGLFLDTPGMRELQLADCEDGIQHAFSDITELAKGCRFTNCQHQAEPDCAVNAAIDSGNLELRRLQSYRKLMREQALNSATLAEKRASDRELGRFYRSVQNDMRALKNR